MSRNPATRETEVADAVILMAYGSPSRAEDIPAYYADIRGGRHVTLEAVAELEERYRRIGGSSPLNEITERQRAALEDELGIPVYVGMRHWHPRIAEAVEHAVADGVTRITGIVLAPHFSRMSVGEYHRQLAEACGDRVELAFVASYHAHPPFIELLAERVGDTDAHVVFTAHSLPERIREQDDPYEEQLLETSKLVADRVGLDSWSFAFQSASPTGEPWLGPDILDELERLHAEGIGKVLVAPIGFVADHLEILWDIDVEAREKAAELSMDLERTESLNDDPAFIRVLAALASAKPVPAPAIRTL
jgi:protoporphyrin/coproporphyrin ferrochelatase